MKSGIILLVYAILIIGWIKCIVKMIECNWEPVGKAEIIYTIGTFTPLGTVIGYINIEDK